jgi:hypothetical protein
MKITNIIGLVLVVIAFGAIGYYINEVDEASWRYWSNYDYESYNYSYPDYSSITFEAALVMIPFTIFFILAYIWNMIKVKTTSTRVFSIIGLSFSLLIVLINLAVLGNPGSLDFTESGGFFIFYHIINLAFFIVLLVQSVRFENRTNVKDDFSDIIDTEIV